MKPSIPKNKSLSIMSVFAVSFGFAFLIPDISAQDNEVQAIYDQYYQDQDIQDQYYQDQDVYDQYYQVQDIQTVDSPNSSTLFGPDTQVSFVWSPEIKVSTIQNETGSTVGFYAGALINKSFLIAGAFGASGDYQTSDYCYFGIMGQYTYNPHKLVHPSAQLLIAAGSTLEYDHQSPNIFDDDISNGAPFYFAEPGVNVEVNLGKKVRLVTGVSYRFAWGLNEYPEMVNPSLLSNNDMSGISCNFGLKFGLY